MITFFGLHLLLGCSFALHFHWIYTICIFLLWFKKPLQQVLQGLALLLAAYCYTLTDAPGPVPEGNQTGILTIHSIQPYSSPFHHSLLYRAELNGHPCSLFFKQGEERLTANCDYFVEGQLIVKERGPPTLKLKKTFSSIEGSWSLAEWRYTQKEKVRRFLSSKMSDQKAAHFLSSLLTGDIDDRQLSLEFRKVGLSHLLAISGLDFALIAAFVGWILRLFLPYRLSLSIQLLFMSAFFFFLGVSPSILRAFVAIALYLIARLFDFQARALHLLGAALIAELIYDPTSIENLGFQLTFLSTFGLLVFYRPMDNFLCYLLPKRPLKILQSMPFFHQHIALFAGWIRQALAITLAAHLLALPVCLYHFHTFPLISLVYNLFFPFLTGLSLLLCLIGLSLGPLGDWVHILNNAFTGMLMRLVASFPPLLDYTLYIGRLPFAPVILFIAGIVWLGLTESPLRIHNTGLFKDGDRSSVG